MCKFLSLVTTDRKDIYYFNCEQRKDMLHGRFCNFIKPDSHASICEYFRINEDAVNKYEWNPFSNVLVLDMKQFDEDTGYILNHLNAQDWTPICGDLEGAREFIASLKDILRFKPQEGFVIPADVKMFESIEGAREAVHNHVYNDSWSTAYAAAWNAARVAARDVVRDAAENAAYDATWDAARVAARDAACEAAWDAACEVAWGAASDAALFCVIKYVCAGLEIPQKHIDYIEKRWSLWTHGYGVCGDNDGILYCYRRL